MILEPEDSGECGECNSNIAVYGFDDAQKFECYPEANLEFDEQDFSGDQSASKIVTMLENRSFEEL